MRNLRRRISGDSLGPERFRDRDSHLSFRRSFPLKEAQCIGVLQPQRDESDVRFGEILLLEAVYGTLSVFLRGTSIDETIG